ncbi:MAG: type 4b pilus protein PilO2 [Alcaligenaceae bacterium]|nr:type 4b pilus protein PilO2 [Alcaligenaceae bacterium]
MRDPHILSMPVARLAFGLHWYPVLARHPLQGVRRLVRLHRANHGVMAGDPVSSVGLTRLARSVMRSAPPLYAAAQVVATLYPRGTVAVVLPVADQGDWFVVVHEGTVVARTDRFLDPDEDPEQLLQEFRRVYPQLIMPGQSGTPALPSLLDIESAVGPGTRLVRLTDAVRHRAWVFLLALVCVLVWWWPATNRTELPPAPHVQRVHPEPRAAWERAIDRSAMPHAVQGVRGFSDLLAVVQAVPVRLGGWLLEHVACRNAGVRWHCEARLGRSHRLASNATLLGVLPAGWTPHFEPLDQVTLHQSFELAGLPLPVANLQTSHHNERAWFSVLQSIQPAFGRVQVGPSVPLEVQAPADPDGVPVPEPQGLSAYARRTVSVQGPLRSLTLLHRHVQAVRWDRLMLSRHDVSEPDVRTSEFMVLIEGALYERYSRVSTR